MTGAWYKFVLRVRYSETDQMGVVYHVNYLNWFEWGRTEMIRAAGMSYRHLEEIGLMLPVTDAEMKFVKPAKYDDIIAVYTRVADFSAVRISFESELRRLANDPDSPSFAESVRLQGEPDEGELLVRGKTRHVWLNRDWKPVRLDREAGQLWNLLQNEK